MTDDFARDCAGCIAAVAGIDLVGVRADAVARRNRRPGGRAVRGGAGRRAVRGRASWRSSSSLAAGGLGYYFGYKPAHVFQGGSRAGLSGTTSGRLDLWQVALRVFEGHPIGGVGLGNYQVVEPSYATQTTLNLTTVRQIVVGPPGGAQHLSSDGR